jgi:hypothetical protein
MSRLNRKFRQSSDDDVFDDNEDLFFAIDAVLHHSKFARKQHREPTNTIIVQDQSSGDGVLLRGPNPKGRSVCKLVCARASQLEDVKRKYRYYVMNSIAEAEGRLERADKYGLDTLKRVTFSSREEWELAWKRDTQNFCIDQTMFEYYMRNEVWANDEYWAVLDKTPEAATHKSFLGYPLWTLSIRRRDEKPLHDWRALQGIKNRIVGEEFEAIELYPADSRIMDTANVYHLWILAPKEGETEPPRFPLGMKNPEQGGAFVDREKAPIAIFTERTKRAFENGEMPLEERKKLVEIASMTDALVFPDDLMAPARMEFPGKEPGELAHTYMTRHPEVATRLKKWEPVL